MNCSRKLFKGNSYVISLPLPNSGVTEVYFYTDGEYRIVKEPTICGDTMYFTLGAEDIELMKDGVLRYEVVGDLDTNSPFMIVTPKDYEAKTLDELLDEAYESGYTTGLEECEETGCTEAYEEGYDDGYASGSTDGYQSGYTDGQATCEDCDDAYESGYTSGVTDGYESGYTQGETDGYSDGYADGYADGQEGCVHDYSEDYFTIEALEDGVLRVNLAYDWSYYAGPGEVSAWHFAPDRNYQLTLSEGDRVSFRGDYARGAFSGNTLSFNVFGNIESLEYGSYFEESGSSVGRDSAFEYMFYGCTGLTSAENLILPATSLTQRCYANMFQGCTSLIAAPELPATTLTGYCYSQMFQGCTSLTTAPELPAAIVPNYAYISLFSGCNSLNYIKCLATEISNDYGTGWWVENVAATGTFVKSPNMSSWTIGINGIPQGWVVEDASDCNCDDAYAEGYASGSTDGYNSGYESGSTDGYQTGYDSGYTDGYSSGVTDGENIQKSKLTVINISKNGTYTRADGYSAITVNVPQTGYTQQDLDNAYASGSTAGYASGYSQGYTAGYADGEATCEPCDCTTAYTSGYSDGYNSGYTSGYSDGSAACHPETRLAVTYNITSSGSNVITSNVASFSKAELEDGTEIDIKSQYYNNRYSFTETGPQTIYYTLTGTTIGNGAFQQVPTIVSFVIPSGTTEIGVRAFQECTSLTSITIPDTVETIDGTSFMGCTALPYINIPGSVKTIDDSAFKGCRNLTGVTLNDGIETLGNSTFSGCTALTEVVFCSSITFIDEGCFLGCYSITRMEFEGTTPPTLGYASSSLGSTSSSFPICVPTSAVSTYQTAYTSYASRISDCS